jgi:hypothetical protein
MNQTSQTTTHVAHDDAANSRDQGFPAAAPLGGASAAEVSPRQMLRICAGANGAAGGDPRPQG